MKRVQTAATAATNNEQYTVTTEQHTPTLEELAEACRKRGNRLEVMNGKVYEVERRLLMEIQK